MTRLEQSNPEIATALGLLVFGLGWTAFTGFVLYPVYRVIVLRWWLSGIRLGGVTATSLMRWGQIYRIYARFMLFAFLYSLAASAIFGLSAGLFIEVVKPFGSSAAVEIAGVVLAVAAYVVMMLGYSAIYQATVTIRLWKLCFETTALEGLQALDNVQARGYAGSAVGEGLADALDVGGL